MKRKRTPVPYATEPIPTEESIELAIGPNGELRLPEALRERLGLHPGGRVVVRDLDNGFAIHPSTPPLSRVYVEPTTLCNLSCLTCMRHSWSEPGGTMSTSTYNSLVEGLRQVSTLRSVAFWGFGEPLLHPEIARMVRLASELGVATELITNGLLLDSDLAHALVKAGLDQIVFSIDGASPASNAEVRAGSDIGTVLANVEGLRRIRDALGSETPEIGLEFVVTRRNVSELPRLRGLAQRVGATFVVVSNVLPYSHELGGEILYGDLAGRTYAEHGGGIRIQLPRLDGNRETIEAVAGLLGRGDVVGSAPASPFGSDGYCRFVSEGTASVAWNGEVSPCIALMHSYTCYVHGREKRVRRKVVGNVAEERLGDIWQEAEYQRFRDRVYRFDFSPCANCGSCSLSETNESDCFGNPHPVCGDCLWAKGVIQCP